MISESSALDWLLEERDPSIRYRALTELLDKDPRRAELRETKADIPTSEPVAKIFSKMHPDGYWFSVDRKTKRGLGDGVQYLDYVTTHFDLAFLSELALDKEDRRISMAAERYLNLQKPDGDFFGHYSCLYSYNLRSFIRMGYRDDPRVKRIVNLMLTTERPDGGYLCDMHEGKYKTRPTKSCIRGSVKALMAFAEMPELWSTPRCEELVRYFLRRRVYFQTAQPSQPAVKDIAKTVFPFVWRASFLEALYALSVMGFGKAPELAEAWHLLDSKKNRSGRYILDWAPTRSYFTPDRRGEPSKWVTLYALLALKHKESAPAREIRSNEGTVKMSGRA